MTRRIEIDLPDAVADYVQAHPDLAAAAIAGTAAASRAIQVAQFRSEAEARGIVFDPARRARLRARMAELQAQADAMPEW